MGQPTMFNNSTGLSLSNMNLVIIELNRFSFCFRLCKLPIHSSLSTLLQLSREDLDGKKKEQAKASDTGWPKGNSIPLSSLVLSWVTLLNIVTFSVFTIAQGFSGLGSL